MKVYKLEVLIIDHDMIGRDEITLTIENTNYPNDCIRPSVMHISQIDIGEWADTNPLNYDEEQRDEYKRLFPNSELNNQKP